MSKQAVVLRRHGLVVTQARVMVLRVLEEEGSFLSASEIQERLIKQGVNLRPVTINNILHRFRMSGLAVLLQADARSAIQPDSPST